MGLEAPESGTLFVRVPLSENLYAVVVGAPASYRTHWVKPNNRRQPIPIRCVAGDGETCVACGQTLKYNVRYMVPVRVCQLVPGALDRRRSESESVLVDPEPVVRILEVGKSCYGFLYVHELRKDFVGLELQVRRKHPHKNGEISLLAVGRREVSLDDQMDAAAAAEVEGLQQYYAWVADKQSSTGYGSQAPLGLDYR